MAGHRKKTDRIVFINTFEPVVPLYRDAFELFEQRNIKAQALISGCQYRLPDEEKNRAGIWTRLWAPAFMQKRRRLCALLYWAMTPFVLLFMRPAKIVFLTQPPLFYLLGAWIARLRGLPYYIHVMDFYPDLLKASPDTEAQQASGLLEQLTRSVLQKAQKVIVIGRCMEQIVLDKGVSPHRIAIVENWPEEAMTSVEDEGNEFRQSHDLGDRLVVLYSGNMGRYHTFDTIIEAARRLKNRTDIMFVFVGRGMRRAQLEEAAKHADNILLLDYQPIDMVARVLRAADVHFISLRKGYEGLMVPSKFYSSLASGRAIIYEGQAQGEVALTISQEQCGQLIPLGDASQLEKHLLNYADNRQLATDNGRKARAAYENHFERTKLAQRYVEVLTSDPTEPRP